MITDTLYPVQPEKPAAAPAVPLAAGGDITIAFRREWREHIIGVLIMLADPARWEPGDAEFVRQQVAELIEYITYS